MSIDYPSEVERLVAELRRRDTDPRCASWPIEDAYGRISHVNTGRDTDKPIVQLYFTLRDMLTRNVRLGETFTDTNRSAWKEDGPRPGWDAVVERLIGGASNGVTSTMIDRMMRQSWTLEDLLRQHRRAHGKARGFTLYDTTSRRMYRTNNIHDVSALKALVERAEFDSAVKSVKILQGNEARRLAGNGRNGPAPFGHRWRVADIPDEQLNAERVAIRWGIRHVTRGGSWGEVAEQWTADGVQPRWTKCASCGKRMSTRAASCVHCGGEPVPPHWHNGNVRSCLYGPDSTPTVGLRHAGLLHTGGEVVGTIVDADGPIVTLDEWRAFESKVSGRSRGRQRGDDDSPYFASGTLVCGGTYRKGRRAGQPCRTLLVGTVQEGQYEDGAQRYGYKCPPRGCRGVTVDGRAAERWTSDQVGKALVSGDNVALLAHVDRDERLVELERMYADALLAVGNAERQQEAAGPDRKQHAADRVVRFEAQLAEISRELQEATARAEREQLSPSEVAELCDMWNDDNTPAWRRRTIMQDCLPGGVFVRPVGKAARLRGEQIFTRFYLASERAS